MRDVIALQRKGDTKTLAPYLQSLVLPDAEHWFGAEFGDDHCGEQNPGADDCMFRFFDLTSTGFAKTFGSNSIRAYCD
jgi:hypothetical protein